MVTIAVKAKTNPQRYLSYYTWIPNTYSAKPYKIASNKKEAGNRKTNQRTKTNNIPKTRSKMTVCFLCELF
jgi:hypothetical protein